MSEMDEKQKKELSRQWRAEQRAKARAVFPILPDRLRAMFDMLDRELPIHGCDHTRRLTERWLEDNHLPVAAVFGWLDDQSGGFCDCEILANVEQQVQDALHGGLGQ
ncbi:MAG: DUF2695 domain-containing protein [Sandaracinaceae bacterium]